MALIPTTWNPSDKSADITLSNEDLTATETALSYNWNSVRSILGVSSGKWYWEVTCSGSTFPTYFGVGIGDSGVSLLGEIYADADGYAYMGYNGNKGNNSSSVSFGDTFDATDIISIALDMDNGKIWWCRNGVWQASGDPAAGTNEAFSGISGTFYAMAGIYRGDAQIANFGASGFTYPVPSGFNSGLGTVDNDAVYDLYSEVEASEEIIVDLLSSIKAGLETINDLNTYIDANGEEVFDLRTHISADFLTNFSDLSSDISTGAEILQDLLGEVKAGNLIISDLLSEATANAQNISDLPTEIRAITYPVYNLSTEITVIRSKWWLNTEIKAGCSALWNFNTEWNPNRFLNTAIEAKKPYSFSFTTQTGASYSVTNPEVELLISGYSQPIRTLFLDYLPVGSSSEYPLQLWWARGKYGRDALKNAKIQAQYINVLDSGGYEVVTCDWLSCKVGAGVYSTVNETALLLGDIPCDSKLDITLKVECLDCSLTRGLVFFKLVFTGDYNEAVYGGTIVYRDGALYHTGLYDDYTSTDFVCRLYIV